MNPDKLEKSEIADSPEDRIFDETIFKEHLRNKLTLLIDSVPLLSITLKTLFPQDPRQKDPFIRLCSNWSPKPFNRTLPS